MNLDELNDKLAQITADKQHEATLEAVIYAGPGAGKSVTRAEVFAELKKRGRTAEEVTEVAKDYTWEDAKGKLAFQPLMMAKQLWKLRRLQGKVEVVLTDTSTLYSLIYGGPAEGVTAAFREYIIDDYKRRNTINFFLKRNPNIPYETAGRNQGSLSEAEGFDAAIQKMLDQAGIPYDTVELNLKDGYHVDLMADRIEDLLDQTGYSVFRPSGMSMMEWNAAGRPNVFNEFIKGEVSTLEDAKQIEGFVFPNGLVTTAKELLAMPAPDPAAVAEITERLDALERERERRIVERRGDMELWEGGPITPQEYAEDNEILRQQAMESALHTFQ